MGELEREAARRPVREKRKAAALETYMDQWEVRKRRQDWSTVAEVCGPTMLTRWEWTSTIGRCGKQECFAAGVSGGIGFD